MKFIEKVSLTIFSTVILVLSLVLCLILFNWLEISYVYYIKCIFFPSYSKEKEEKKEGILLENESGKLLISMETIENLVKGVVFGFPSIKSINCKVKLDKQINNVVIDLNLVVTADTIIKELSVNLQSKIKEVIKTTTEIDVKEINIKIKNIENQKEN